MRPTRRRPSTALAGLLGTLLLGGLVACGEERSSAATTEPPEKGECRLLTPEDVARPSNGTATVPCGDRHTAQTFEVGELPEELHDLEPDDPALGTHVYGECSSSFAGFLKGDESAVMRSVVSWVWFRPDDASWDAGARWFRCDVIGGGEQLTPYRALPKNAKGLLEGLPPDQWMVCATGRSVQSGTKVPCSEPHTWRAVTTIKVGEPGEPYPGDDAVAEITSDFCSDSVGAWLGYPTSYDYGSTFFGEAEWEAGNRRSVCWARTQQ
ncbi:MAG: septum formation family protein [Nocardioides sp.]